MRNTIFITYIYIEQWLTLNVPNIIISGPLGDLCLHCGCVVQEKSL